MKLKFGLGAVALMLVAGGAATVIAQSPAAEPTESLTLYNSEDFGGTPVIVTSDTPDLQAVSADEGFDGTANDYAYSIRTTGKWQVCMDAAYETSCLVVDGEMASLGDNGGSISSVRYLGPSENQAPTAVASGAAAPTGSPTASAPVAVAANEPEWEPMYNVDLFGNDYREIAYSTPGNGWKTCKASCDADNKCQAWTYVPPGRTDNGECFLKAPVPEASESDCCISGLKGGASSAGTVGDAAIARGLRRLGDTAVDALEDEANRAVDRKVRDVFGQVIGG